ncbi:hypothetical protein LDL36_18440 [Komagataeibacter sp. FNDCR1]|nr:hypothetical protein [Komagataeibacter sp. FNDCR1]
MMTSAEIRLPLKPDDDEVRLFWADLDDCGADITFFGEPIARHLIMNALSAPAENLDFGKLGFEEHYDLRARGLITKTPSVLDQLAAMGFDRKTALFSMRRPPTTPKEAVQTDSQLDEISYLLFDVAAQLAKGANVKGVVVHDEDEMGSIREKLDTARSLLSDVLNAPAGEEK